jgi:VanZ family protein
MMFWRYHLPVIMYAGLIFLISSISSLPTKMPFFTLKDKLIHFLEYAVFGFLLWRSAIRWKIDTGLARLILLTLILGMAYAGSDEIHQYYVPGRDGNIYDWIADVIGLAVGLVTAYIFAGRKITFRSSNKD